MFSKQVQDKRRMLIGVLILSSLLFIQVQAKSDQANPKLAAPTGKPAVAGSRRPPQNRLPPSAGQYYSLFWGVDSLKVKSAESGEVIRFTYRVLDPEKAKALNDKKNEPSLVDPGAGVSLVVPEMEKVGKLRQSGTPVAGTVYWMAFSNKGMRVRPGHRVSVVIGHFHADGLIVQ